MYMKLKGGRSKALTFSYDDGAHADRRIMDILDRYGMRATFHNNSASPEVLAGLHPELLTLSEMKAVYAGRVHEVCMHGRTHPFLNRLHSVEIVDELLSDRRSIEGALGRVACGFSYPFGQYNGEVIAALRAVGILYARTTRSTEEFRFPENWYEWHPTCHQKSPKIFALCERFLADPVRFPSENMLFYIWGHGSEYQSEEDWAHLERLCQTLHRPDEIWYATNIEIYEYVEAYRHLVLSADLSRVYNPTATDVWVWEKGKTYVVPSGGTVIFDA